MPRLHYQRTIPFPREAVFDLVADVERYPAFLPGWREARILRQSDDMQRVEQVLGGLGFSFRFRTTAAFNKPESIRIETRDNPFRHLFQHWRFEALGDRLTRVTLDADYELHNPLIGQVVTLALDRALRRTLTSFEQRAHDVLG